MTFSPLHHTATKALLVAALFWPVRAAAWAQDKKPLPDAEAQKRALGLLHDVYGKEYDAAKTSKEKTELATKLLDQAAKSQADPASHFVLLRVAKDVAVLAADAETALQAVERIVATYDVDAIEMRLDCVKGLADAARFSSQHAALAEQAYSLLDLALSEDDFEAAGQFGRIAQDSAKRGRNYSLLKKVVARMEKLDELEQAHAEYQKAVARLEESPTDAEANLAAGRYLCLSRGDWERGIPMLALGSDPALKAPAVKELGGADSPDAHIALGDAWWDLAQTKQGRERDCFLLRAGHWYEKAQAKVTSGLGKVKLDQRLDQIAKIEPPAGHLAATGPDREAPPSAAAAVKPFDPATAMLLATLEGHTGSVRSIDFSPDGKTLVTASADKTVRFWDVAERQPSGTLPTFSKSDLGAIFSPAGSLLAVANGDSTISLWNTARVEPRGMLGGHRLPVACLAFSPDGSLLASGAPDNAVILWDVRRGRIVRPLGPLASRPSSVAFNPDGSLVASGSIDGVVTVWEVVTGRPRHTLTGHRGSVRCVAVSPKGNVLASASGDGTVKLWDMQAGTLQRTLQGRGADLSTVAIRADGATLAASGRDGAIRLWDPASGTLRRMLSGHFGTVLSLDFSPDGSLLASAGADHTVKLWGTDPSGKLPSPEPVVRARPGVMIALPPFARREDLRVEQVFLRRGVPGAWICNHGDGRAVGVEVQFTVDGEPADTCRVDVSFMDMAEATGSKLPAGEHVVRVMVDPENRIAEVNEANNALEATLTVRLTPDGLPAPPERMPMPKGEVSTSGLTPDAEGWILLPPLVQADRDTRVARWKWDGQTASFSTSSVRMEQASVSFPVRVVGSYELQARVVMTQPQVSTRICLPIVGTRVAVLHLRGARGGIASRAATIRLEGVVPQPRPQASALISANTEYAFSCRVAVSQARVRLEVVCDDEILFEWAGPVSQVAERSVIRPGTVELQTGCYGPLKFRDLRLRMFSGQATAIVSE